MDDDRVIVIGSGPCGAMAAATLVGRGVDVLMLDAGLRAPAGFIVRAAGNTLLRRIGWNEYSTDRLDPTSATDVDWFSSLSLGGLSNYWTAAVPRFAPADFTDGSAARRAVRVADHLRRPRAVLRTGRTGPDA